MASDSARRYGIRLYTASSSSGIMAVRNTDPYSGGAGGSSRDELDTPARDLFGRSDMTEA
eukprot:4396640-Prymnesium_polylepis.2